jgi:hypothetical protein
MQEASFLDTLSIWGRQERFSSIITPKNFVSDTCLTARPLSNKQADTYLAVFIERDETGVKPLVRRERFVSQVKDNEKRIIIKEGGGL